MTNGKTSREHSSKRGSAQGFPAWLQLVRAYNYMEARVSADLRADKLTLARFDVLVVLDKYGPMSQQALAGYLLVTKGNVVGLIDGLSARGLVERTRSKTDGRVNLVRATRSGSRLVERVLPRQIRVIEALMKPLSNPEAAALKGFLARLRTDSKPPANNA
jgi:DNA-binding MarR family transcriptional regulator